jgi:hypothetical protein
VTGSAGPKMMGPKASQAGMVAGLERFAKWVVERENQMGCEGICGAESNLGRAENLERFSQFLIQGIVI